MEAPAFWGLIKQIIRFGISGALAALTGVACLYLLTEQLHVWYLAGSVVAFFATFTAAFCLQKFWTFQNIGAAPVTKQVGLSLVLTGVVFLINLASMFLLVEKVGLHYAAAQAVTYATIGFLDFFAYKFLIFKP